MNVRELIHVLLDLNPNARVYGGAALDATGRSHTGELRTDDVLIDPALPIVVIAK